MMKKTLLILTTVALVWSLTSCLNDNEDNIQTQSMSVTLYNRVISGTEVPSFSTSTNQMILNYTAATLSIGIAAVDIDGETVTFSCPDMPLTYDESIDAYRFTGAATTISSTAIVTDLNGIIDMNVGVMYMTYRVNGHTVYASSGLGYAYCRTLMKETGDMESPTSFTSNKPAYSFAIDPTQKKASLSVYGFLLPNNNIAYPNVSGKGLDYTVTNDGYEFAADTVTMSGENNTSLKYQITNFKASITNQGKTVNVSYDYDKYQVTANGTMFGIASGKLS